MSAAIFRFVPAAVAAIAFALVSYAQLIPHRLSDQEAMRIVGGCGASCGGNVIQPCPYSSDGCGDYQVCDSDGAMSCIPMQFCTGAGCGGAINGGICQ